MSSIKTQTAIRNALDTAGEVIAAELATIVGDAIGPLTEAQHYRLIEKMDELVIVSVQVRS